MKIAQTTSACSKYYGGYHALPQIAKRYAEIGYTGVDLSFTDITKENSLSPLKESDWQDWAVKTGEAIQETGIRAVQSHTPIFNAFSSDIPGLEEKTELMKRAIAASGIIGIPWVVVHPNTDYCDNRYRVNLTKNQEFFKPLLEVAAKYNCGIAIENLFDTYHSPLGVKGSSEKSDRRVDHHLISQRRFGSNPEELLELTDALSMDFPNVGICWDFGHANEAGLGQVKSLEWLGHRVKALHVNDNQAVFDDHLTPFCGSIPWEEIMPCLNKIGYEGSFTYENIKFINRLPEPLVDAALDYSLKVARYLINLM